MMAVAMANHKKQTEAVKPAESTRKRTAILVPVTKKPDPVPHKAPKIANEVYYVCELCPSTFNRKFNRDRHMEVMHGAAVSTRTRPLYPDRIRNSEYSPDADLSDDNIPEPKIPVQEPPPLAKPVLVNPVDPAVKPTNPAVAKTVTPLNQWNQPNQWNQNQNLMMMMTRWTLRTFRLPIRTFRLIL